MASSPRLGQHDQWLGLAGSELHNVPLSEYTSWRVGGPADRFYLPVDADDLAVFLRRLDDDVPLFWLGLGSNLLVRDGGIRGAVICTKNRLKRLEKVDDVVVFAQSGVPCALIARFCADAGLRGAEFLAGIPGTLGGALAMNAGAFGGETWTLVRRVRTIDRQGMLRWRMPEEFAIAYRSVTGLPVDEWYLGAELALRHGSSDESRSAIRDLLSRRASSQPTNLPSCGSVFRNPPGDHAGRLVEASGLKGFRIGGAQVSPKHANFIVNLGDASALDIERMILHVQAEVERCQGVKLVTEVRVVGEPAKGDEELAR
jgi:UDP-N-acetylmuramate dehydrogenase